MAIRVLIAMGNSFQKYVSNESWIIAVSQNPAKREREIIIARRLSENPITLEELSKKYNISRERIRQIETKAFEKLQKTMINSRKSKNLLPAD